MTQTLSIPPVLQKADCIEKVLCLSTLIASGELSELCNLDDSDRFYEEELKGDCGNCPYIKKCLAIIINQ